MHSEEIFPELKKWVREPSLLWRCSGC